MTKQALFKQVESVLDGHTYERCMCHDDYDVGYHAYIHRLYIACVIRVRLKGGNVHLWAREWLLSKPDELFEEYTDYKSIYKGDYTEKSIANWLLAQQLMPECEWCWC